jgi:hypothetical protein
MYSFPANLYIYIIKRWSLPVTSVLRIRIRKDPHHISSSGSGYKAFLVEMDQGPAYYLKHYLDIFY